MKGLCCLAIIIMVQCILTILSFYFSKLLYGNAELQKHVLTLIWNYIKDLLSFIQKENIFDQSWSILYANLFQDTGDATNYKLQYHHNKPKMPSTRASLLLSILTPLGSLRNQFLVQAATCQVCLDTATPGESVKFHRHHSSFFYKKWHLEQGHKDCAPN